jgi:hypothetical protein
VSVLLFWREVFGSSAFSHHLSSSLLPPPFSHKIDNNNILLLTINWGPGSNKGTTTTTSQPSSITITSSTATMKPVKVSDDVADEEIQRLAAANKAPSVAPSTSKQGNKLGLEDDHEDEFMQALPHVVMPPGELVSQFSLGSINSFNASLNNLSEGEIHRYGSLMETAVYLSSVMEDQKKKYKKAPPPPLPVFHPLREVPPIEDILSADDEDEHGDLLFAGEAEADCFFSKSVGDDDAPGLLFATPSKVSASCVSPTGVMDFPSSSCSDGAGAENLLASDPVEGDIQHMVLLEPKDLFGGADAADAALRVSTSPVEKEREASAAVLLDEEKGDAAAAALLEPIPAAAAMGIVTPPAVKGRKSHADAAAPPGAPRKVSILQSSMDDDDAITKDHLLFTPSIRQSLMELFSTAEEEEEQDSTNVSCSSPSKEEAAAEPSKEAPATVANVTVEQAIAETELILKDSPLVKDDSPSEQPAAAKEDTAAAAAAAAAAASDDDMKVEGTKAPEAAESTTIAEEMTASVKDSSIVKEGGTMEQEPAKEELAVVDPTSDHDGMEVEAPECVMEPEAAAASSTAKIVKGIRALGISSNEEKPAAVLETESIQPEASALPSASARRSSPRLAALATIASLASEMAVEQPVASEEPKKKGKVKQFSKTVKQASSTRIGDKQSVTSKELKKKSRQARPDDSVSSSKSASKRKAARKEDLPSKKPKKGKTSGDGHGKEDVASKDFHMHHAEQWSDMYEQAVEFREKHGHCRIPQNFHTDKSLGLWAKRQRYQYTLLKEDPAKSTLSPERLELLENIGFCFHMSEAAWYDRYDELVEFFQETGHSNVPSTYKNKKLANWVKVQRRMHCCATENNPYPKHRIKAMEKVNFKWKCS